jgi:hypothetical protein
MVHGELLTLDEEAIAEKAMEVSQQTWKRFETIAAQG